MSLQIASINSGSNGNCYYVGNESTAVLIDVGISGTQTVKRLKALGLNSQIIKAIFISHEHTDHVLGANTLAAKFKIPVYSSLGTARRLQHALKSIIVPFETNNTIRINDLEIIPFLKKHDAHDPHSFVVHHQGISVGIFTDIGHACEQLKHYFKQCQAVFLEANYDATMLENGPYPLALKNRIKGDWGHLSNDQALELLQTHRNPELSHLILTHLSKENNAVELVDQLFRNHANGAMVHVASRHEASPVFVVHAKPTPVHIYMEQKQMSLF
jgi:phosphoribosyl 1,2-cyclic phosphodiesterase